MILCGPRLVQGYIDRQIWPTVVEFPYIPSRSRLSSMLCFSAAEIKASLPLLGGVAKFIPDLCSGLRWRWFASRLAVLREDLDEG